MNFNAGAFADTSSVHASVGSLVRFVIAVTTRTPAFRAATMVALRIPNGTVEAAI